MVSERNIYKQIFLSLGSNPIVRAGVARDQFALASRG